MNYIIFLVYLYSICNVAKATFCEIDTRRDSEMVIKGSMGDFNFEPDEKTKHHFFCQFFNSKIMDAEGNFDKMKYIESTKEEDRQNQSIYVDECIERVGKNADETGWNIHKCLIEQHHSHELPKPYKGAEYCLSESNATGILVWIGFQRGFTFESEELKYFMHCYFQHIGYFDEDGVIDREPSDLRGTKMMPIYKHCTRELDVGSVENSWNMVQCFRRTIARFW